MVYFKETTKPMSKINFYKAKLGKVNQSNKRMIN